MANFSAVLRKTIDGLENPTPALRQRVYAKARATIEQKLTAANAGPEAAERQRRILEEAIAEVEQDYGEKLTEPAPAEASEPKPKEPVEKPAAAPLEPREPEALGEPGREPLTPPEEEFDEVRSESATVRPEAPRAPKPAPSPARQRSEFDDILFGPDGAPEDYGAATPSFEPARERKRAGGKKSRGSRGAGRLVAALIAIVAVAGIGFAGWAFRSDIGGLLGASKGPATTREASAPPAPAQQTTPGTGAGVPAATSPAPAEPQQKFTQRLMPDGREVDAGPAAEKPGTGEGTSLAAQSAKETPPPAATAPATSQPAPQTTAPQEAAPQSPAKAETLPVGQKAFFYEERTGQEAGTAKTGAVVWSEIQQSPGAGAPPEPAIRAEVTIPENGLTLRMTIQRNADKSLPASHLIELVFTVPDNFPGGSIDNVQRVTFKDTEQVAGNPLVAIPAKIADNFFIVALNDAPTAVTTNTTLLRREEWIDIPITYRTGRRALITLEKGVPGDRVFDEVLKAWSDKTGG